MVLFPREKSSAGLNITVFRQSTSPLALVLDEIREQNLRLGCLHDTRLICT